MLSQRAQDEKNLLELQDLRFQNQLGNWRYLTISRLLCKRRKSSLCSFDSWTFIKYSDRRRCYIVNIAFLSNCSLPLETHCLSSPVVPNCCGAGNKFMCWWFCCLYLLSSCRFGLLAPIPDVGVLQEKNWFSLASASQIPITLYSFGTPATSKR